MKNNRLGFTLIELLAVIVVLAVLMLIAVPNTIALLDKNKKTDYIEDAKMFVSLVQNKVQIDKKLELPISDAQGLIVTLGYLNTNDLDISPYGEKYDGDASFVAISFSGGRYYYNVHLVSCVDKTDCDSKKDDRRGIEFTDLESLNGDNRFELVKSKGINAGYIDDLAAKPGVRVNNGV